MNVNKLRRHSVLWFVVITVAFSFGAYFLPLPVEQKSLLATDQCMEDWPKPELSSLIYSLVR